MLRLWSIAIILALITALLIPMQWLSVLLRLPSRRWIPVTYHRIVCALIGVRVRVDGVRLTGQPVLLVANHTSWLDIPVITAVAPVVFVAKREVGTWPIFGLLAKLQRSVFVDRERRHKTAEVNAEIGSRVAGGDPVVLFAEGTSNDGNRVLPFRSALIGAASHALSQIRRPEVLIQPLSIAYPAFQGVAMGRQHRPIVAWYGDIDLLPHLGAVLARGALDAVVTWGEPVTYRWDADRKAVAKTLEGAVRRLTTDVLRGRAATIGRSKAASEPFLFPGNPFKRRRATQPPSPKWDV
jgi:lyso-ornithine lipid O-acyltransferase